MQNMPKTHSTATRTEPIFCTQNGRGITKTSWTHLQRFKLQLGCPEVEVLEGAQALVQGGVEGHALQIRRKTRARFEKNVSILRAQFGRYVPSLKTYEERNAILGG